MPLLDYSCFFLSFSCVPCGSFVFCHSPSVLCPCQVDLRRAVEEVVKETPEYRCMQSQFSVLYNESLQLKAQLDEARTLLHGTRSTHQRQVELIEVIVSFGQRCYQSQILKLKEWALIS